MKSSELLIEELIKAVTKLQLQVAELERRLDEREDYEREQNDS